MKLFFVFDGAPHNEVWGIEGTNYDLHSEALVLNFDIRPITLNMNLSRFSVT